MALYDQEIQKKRRKRVVELLKEGLTTRQISERTGMTTRSVLRIKKQEANRGKQEEVTT